jgi:hypothetical protein
MRGKGAALLFLVALLPSRAGTAQEVRIFEDSYNWSHPNRLGLTEQDLLFTEPFTGSFDSRAFYFLGLLDEGTQFVINIFNWAYGYWGGWGMSVVVIEPDGSVYVCEEKIPEKEITFAQDRFFIRFADSVIEGADGLYRIRISREDFSCDIFVSNLLPLWQPGDGYVFLTEERDAFLRLGVPCPWALTSGYLVVRGRRISASGQCYGDRSRHSLPINRMNSPTLAFRAFSRASTPLQERWFISVLHYTTHRSYGARQVPIMILARGGDWVFTTKELLLTPRDFRDSGRHRMSFPHRFEVEAEGNGYSLQGQFLASQLYHRTDIFEKIPRIFRPIASLFFKRPVIFRMTGCFQGTVTAPDGSPSSLLLFGQCEYSIVD